MTTTPIFKQKSLTVKIFFCCLLASAAALFIAGCQSGHAVTAVEAIDSENQAKQIFVYYFHRTIRCPTCIAMEALSKEAIETNFSEELKNNKIVWITTNIDDPNNNELAQKYDIVRSTLLVVDTKDGQELRYKKLEKIWEHIGNRDAFLTYVKNEVADYAAQTSEVKTN